MDRPAVHGRAAEGFSGSKSRENRFLKAKSDQHKQPLFPGYQSRVMWKQRKADAASSADPG